MAVTCLVWGEEDIRKSHGQALRLSHPLPVVTVKPERFPGKDIFRAAVVCLVYVLDVDAAALWINFSLNTSFVEHEKCPGVLRLSAVRPNLPPHPLDFVSLGHWGISSCHYFKKLTLL